MVIGRINYSIEAKRWFTITYPWLGDTEKVIAPTEITVSPDDGMFTVDNAFITADGKSVQFQTSANGNDVGGNRYDVEVIVNTDASQRNADCLEFIMQEAC